jgi:hypothetical protein
MSLQYMSRRPSNYPQPPICRKPSFGASIGISARGTGKRGNVDNAASSTFLQLTAINFSLKPEKNKSFGFFQCAAERLSQFGSDFRMLGRSFQFAA